MAFFTTKVTVSRCFKDLLVLYPFHASKSSKSTTSTTTDTSEALELTSRELGGSFVDVGVSGTGSSSSSASRTRTHVHRMVERMIRVNHAAERAAVMVSAGRTSLRSRRLQAVKKQPALFFENAIKENRVRPSLLLPLWDIIGFSLGIGSVFLNEMTAARFTDAIQEAISDHCNSQLRDLIANDLAGEKMLEAISKCRDESLRGTTNNAVPSPEQAMVDPLTQLVKTSSRFAVGLSEQV